MTYNQQPHITQGYATPVPQGQVPPPYNPGNNFNGTNVTVTGDDIRLSGKIPLPDFNHGNHLFPSLRHMLQ